MSSPFISATRVFEEHVQNLEELDEDPGLLGNRNFHFTATVDESRCCHINVVLELGAGLCSKTVANPPRGRCALTSRRDVRVHQRQACIFVACH